MSTLKKLFITMIGVLLITFGYSQGVYASELVNQEDVDDTYLSQSETEVSFDTDESELTENEIMIDTEAYEVYVDEQGQVYYIEKKPVEPEAENDKDVQKQEEKTVQSKKTEQAKNNKNSDKKPTYTEEELRLLSCLVYAEAGNQSYEGMLAVANVVLNRVKSQTYSHVNTIEEVIYDKKWAVQFSVTVKNKNGKSVLDRALECYDTGKFPGRNPEGEKKAMNRAIKAAKAALNGENNLGDYLCFRLNNKNASSIKKKYNYIIIGDHIFYRTK